MRVYLIPMYFWTPPKHPYTARVAICNRKCGFGPHDLIYEDTLGFFGGGVEAGETPEEALRRELTEELPSFEYSILEKVYGSEDFVVFSVEAGIWSQEEYQKLAGTCNEGFVHAVFSRPDLSQEQFLQHLQNMRPLGPFVVESLAKVFESP